MFFWSADTGSSLMKMCSVEVWSSIAMGFTDPHHFKTGFE
jgi:hypothetical protein